MKAIEKLCNEHDALLASYRGVLKAAEQVARGALEPGQLQVDLQADSWQVVEARERGDSADEQALPEREQAVPLRVEGGIEGLRQLALAQEARQAPPA